GSMVGLIASPDGRSLLLPVRGSHVAVGAGVPQSPLAPYHPPVRGNRQFTPDYPPGEAGPPRAGSEELSPRLARLWHPHSEASDEGRGTGPLVRIGCCPGRAGRRFRLTPRRRCWRRSPPALPGRSLPSP